MKTKHGIIFYVATIIPLCYAVLILNASNIDKSISLLTAHDTIKTCNEIMTAQANRIILLENELHKTQIVKVSFYHPASRGINSDSDHTKTATMTKPVVGRTVAISRKLFDDGWFGRKIYIKKIGVFWADDLMSPSIQGNQIDICVGSRKLAMKLGVKNGVVAVRL